MHSVTIRENFNNCNDNSASARLVGLLCIDSNNRNDNLASARLVGLLQITMGKTSKKMAKASSQKKSAMAKKGKKKAVTAASQKKPAVARKAKKKTVKVASPEKPAADKKATKKSEVLKCLVKKKKDDVQKIAEDNGVTVRYVNKVKAGHAVQQQLKKNRNFRMGAEGSKNFRRWRRACK